MAEIGINYAIYYAIVGGICVSVCVYLLMNDDSLAAPRQSSDIRLVSVAQVHTAHISFIYYIESQCSRNFYVDSSIARGLHENTIWFINSHSV